MEKITFVIPSRNNLEFLKLAYKSIQNLQNNHEILVLNDASTDGTIEWINSLNDKNLIVYNNPGTERIGIVGMFDKGIEMATTNIIMAFHADMVASPTLDIELLKYLERGTIVSATRVEPPLHPEGPEKIIHNFGVEPEEFNFTTWNEWCTNAKFKEDYDGKLTPGIFAPWCMYKEDFLAIGGHDELFAPQSREDSDLFCRFKLAGYRFIQTWNGVVYHFTSRGSRFNKHAGGDIMKDSPEWQQTNSKNERNFIRKWGIFPHCGTLMQPIVPHKYGMAFTIKNCTPRILQVLEPWCDRIYIDNFTNLTNEYFQNEKNNTSYDLSKRVHSLIEQSKYDYDNIVVDINSNTFNNDDYALIRQLPIIISDSGEIGSFELGNLKINIHSLETHENNLIINKEKKNVKNF
jgi:glycosyltransferase involved in cell wall biosynthesis